jgi:hypothetical protein
MDSIEKYSAREIKELLNSPESIDALIPSSLPMPTLNINQNKEKQLQIEQLKERIQTLIQTSQEQKKKLQDLFIEQEEELQRFHLNSITSNIQSVMDESGDSYEERYKYHLLGAKKSLLEKNS